MTDFNLREELKTLKDKRRGQAQQHKIDVVLMITIMATMSGYQGYRAMGGPFERHTHLCALPRLRSSIFNSIDFLIF